MAGNVVTVQAVRKDVHVRRLGENVLLTVEPDGTVVCDVDFFDALVKRIVVRANELEQERTRGEERQRAHRAW